MASERSKRRDFLSLSFITKSISTKTIIRVGFCDIQNNQGLGNCYQPRPSARLITLTSTLISNGW